MRVRNGSEMMFLNRLKYWSKRICEDALSTVSITALNDVMSKPQYLKVQESN